MKPIYKLCTALAIDTRSRCRHLLRKHAALHPLVPNQSGPAMDGYQKSAFPRYANPRQQYLANQNLTNGSRFDHRKGYEARLFSKRDYDLTQLQPQLLFQNPKLELSDKPDRLSQLMHQH